MEKKGKYGKEFKYQKESMEKNLKYKNLSTKKKVWKRN